MEDASLQVLRSWQRLSYCVLFLLLLSSQLQPTCLALTLTLTLTPFAVVGSDNSNHLFKPFDEKGATHSDSWNSHRKLVALNLSSDSESSPPPTLPSFARDDETTDSEEELASVRSWKSTSAKAKEAVIVYHAPSLLDDNALVEVKKRIDGWHTLGVVGGPTKSIYHGVFRKDETTGLVDPYALGPSEYIRTMASVALCLSAPQQHEHEQMQSASSSSPTRTTSSNSSISTSTSSSNMRFLHMGYGSGSLMRFLRHAIPGSQHEAIELDPAVVKAALDLGLVDNASACENLVVGDALEYKRDEEAIAGFHGVCIDVFDGSNLMPPGFYSVPFLETLRDNVLGGDIDGGESENESENESETCCVIHNFHVGTERLQNQLEDAMMSYRTVFGNSCCSGAAREEEMLHSLYRVDSLNTNNHGGNTILVAIKKTPSTSDDVADSSWLELAALATERWEEKRFDVASRILNVRPF